MLVLGIGCFSEGELHQLFGCAVCCVQAMTVSVATLLFLICIDYGVVRGGLEGGHSHEGGHGHTEHGHSHAVPVLPDDYGDSPREEVSFAASTRKPALSDAPPLIPMPQPLPASANGTNGSSRVRSSSNSTEGNLT